MVGSTSKPERNLNLHRPRLPALYFPAQFSFVTWWSTAFHGPFVFVRLVAYRSKPPEPPGRFDTRKSVSRSEERYACLSSYMLLTVGPRFTGTDHASATVSLVATHMSKPPSVPPRSEKRNNSSPSKRGTGRWSLCGLLSSATRLAGPKDPSATCALT